MDGRVTGEILQNDRTESPETRRMSHFQIETIELPTFCGGVLRGFVGTSTGGVKRKRIIILLQHQIRWDSQKFGKIDWELIID